MSDENCYICNTIEKPLVKILNEDENGNSIENWICMKHLFMKILDTGMKQMHNNMSEYVGDLFNYKDEFQN